MAKGNTMTNNNHRSPHNCACAKLSCASFVAGNQCFRCQQVDNRKAGIRFNAEMDEWKAWFACNRKRVKVHEAGPNYRPSASMDAVVWPGGGSVDYDPGGWYTHEHERTS
tara:strand:+ start:512 stop:841 length:330 start_codon:yes stop_codon:yes gene_type:complete